VNGIEMIHDAVGHWFVKYPRSLPNAYTRVSAFFLSIHRACPNRSYFKSSIFLVCGASQVR